MVWIFFEIHQFNENSVFDENLSHRLLCVSREGAEDSFILRQNVLLRQNRNAHFVQRCFLIRQQRNLSVYMLINCSLGQLPYISK